MRTMTRLIALLSTLLMMPFPLTRGMPTSSTYKVQLQSSNIQIPNSFDATLSGSSSDQQYGVNIQGNVGTVKQGSQTTNVVVNQQIPMGQYMLYAIMGENSNSIIMGWVYCKGSQLTFLWLEDTAGTHTGFTPSLVTGTCAVSNTEKDVSFTITPEDITINLAPSCPTINGGSSLSLAPGSVGNVALGGQPYNLAPFAVIDCSNCASKADGGWWEVHSLMSAKQSSNVCVGIFYLPTQNTGTVNLSYLTCFKPIDDSGASFTATYSLPTNTDAKFRSA